MKRLIIASIRVYRKYISPSKIRSCRFSPTCSEYATEALGHFGLFRGTGLSIWRVLRCNPFSRGGFDPVQRKR